MIFRAILLVIIGALSLTTSAADRSRTPDTSDAHDIVGTYASFPGFTTTVVELKPDGTFVYTHETCLSSDKTVGVWRVVAPNLILANSELRQAPSTIVGDRDPSAGKITVRVTDALETPIPGVSVSLSCTGGELLEAVSAVDGEAEFGACDVHSVHADIDGFESAESTFENQKLNLFSVALEPTRFLLDDQLWYVHDGKLYELHWPLEKREPE